MSDSGYIYVGTYFHHHGKDLSNLTEKKIGKSVNVPSRENALNSTKFTIGYTMIKYWAVNSMSQIEKSLHSILPNRLNGEWFEDDDDTLVDRVTKFMEIMGAVEENVNTTDLDPVAKKIVQSAKDRSRVAELAGQQFSVSREDILVTIEITPEGQFKCVQTGTIHNKPNGAFTERWKDRLAITPNINAWGGPRNSNNRTIDQELELLPTKETV